MKLWTKTDWIIIIFIFFIFGFSLAMTSYLPDKVPTHWDIKGEVDAWGSKYINLFLMPGLALLIYLLMSFLPTIDPLRKNYDKFAKPYQYFKIFLAAFFVYLYFVILLSSITAVQSKGNLMFGIPMAILFLFIGWFLPQLKRNFFIGIRLPWTLVSDENWKKTHDFGGRVFMTVGVLILIASFISSVISFIVIISGALLAIIVTAIYSYLVFKKEKYGKSSKNKI